VEIVPSIIAGDTQFAFPIASTAIPQVQGGRVRALAVTSARRLPTLADVPTLAEALKAPELVLDAWFGLWAPAGTPAPVVDTVFKAVVRAHEDGTLRADTEAAGSLVALSGSPAEFTKFIEAETQKFERLVKAAGLSAGN
jgi:tripartite-type tricarboxylate transporter receptor subunit TctC